jgi:hypothetical protein
MSKLFTNSRYGFILKNLLKNNLKKAIYPKKYCYSTTQTQKEELTPLAQQLKNLITVHIMTPCFRSINYSFVKDIFKKFTIRKKDLYQ